MSDSGLKKLGIIASEECRKPREGKRWWHLRRYVGAYARVIGAHEVVATEHTAEIVRASYAEARDGDSSLPKLEIKSIGPTTRGVVKLAAMVATREVGRVLWFQDPNDLLVGRAENYALIRNCNLAGAHLMMNAAAHLWALHQSDPKVYKITPCQEGDACESVFLIAHDGEKARMSRFVFQYRDVLSRFPRLLATSGTLKHIEKVQSDYAPKSDSLKITAVGKTATLSHGPSGGDVIVADEIFDWYGVGGRAYRGEYVFHHVLFFPDHLQSHPHEADIRVLLEACANPLHRVNLVLNSRTAAEWAERYRREPSSAALSAQAQ